MPGLLSVTVAPATSALATLAHAKDELQITDTSADSYLTRQIDMASGVIARHCSRDFGKQTLSETFRYGWTPGIGIAAQQVAPYGTPLNVQFKPLILTIPPIVVSSIVENDGTPLTAGTDYEADMAAGLLYRLRSGIRSWWSVPEVVVAYDAGYQLPNDAPVSGVPALPAEVESICIALVLAAYSSRGFDRSIVLDWTEGLGRTTYSPSRTLAPMVLDAAAKEILAPYVLREW